MFKHTYSTMPNATTKAAATKLRAQIQDFISRQQNNSFNYKQVSAAIGAKSAPAQRSVAMMLAELAFDGELVETAPGKYKAPARSNFTRARSCAAPTVKTAW